MESRSHANLYRLGAALLGGVALTSLCLGALVVALLSPNTTLHLRLFELSVERPEPPSSATFTAAGVASTPTVSPLWAPATAQRLDVSFRRADGYFGIGRGCPGRDGRGQVEAHHLVVRGVDTHREVSQILIAGDNHTNWARFCSSQTWELAAQNRGDGTWDLYFAPAPPTRFYTVIFTYTDSTFALGMVNASP